MVPEEPNVKSTATSSSSSNATAISGKACRSDDAAYTSIVFSGPETDRTTATTAFASGKGAALEQAAYDPRSVAGMDDAQVREVSELVHQWIANHRPEAGTATREEAAC